MSHMQWRLKNATRTLAPLVLVLTASAGGARPEADEHTVEITASRYRFEPAQVEAREGERVRFVLRSADTTHGLRIKGLGVEVLIPKGGAAVTVEFVARSGHYRMECSEYCGSGHKRMRGDLVVVEAAS